MNLPKSTVELGYMCTREHKVHQLLNSTSSWSTKRDCCLFSKTILKSDTIIDMVPSWNPGIKPSDHQWSLAKQ